MEQKINKLVLIRGLCGSGKTTLAEKLAKENNGVCVSADDFFTIDGSYKFSFNLIRAAHQYCLGTAFYNLYRGNNVYVHNTFTQQWEIEPYVDMAFTQGYEWELIESTTKWKYDVEECAKKTVHNVPATSIEKMRARWESTKDLLKHFEKYKNK